MQVADALMKRVALELGWESPTLDIKTTRGTGTRFVAPLRRCQAGLCKTPFASGPNGGVCTCAKAVDRHLENLADVVGVFLTH